jgi:hypothetical protein
MRLISDILKPLKITTSPLLVVILGLILSLSAQAQGWEKYYGTEANEEANAIIQTSDHGYAIVGTTTVIQGGFATFILRTDIDGTEIWQTTYNIPNASEFGNSIIEDQDGNLVITGETNSGEGGRDVFVMKFNAKGDTLWSQPVIFGDGDDDRGFDIINTSDGGYLVVGSYSILGEEDFYAIKLDIDGNEEWQRNWGTDSKDVLRAVVQTPEGDYIVTGSTGENDESDIYVARLAPDGDILWTNIFGLAGENDVAYDIIRSDTNYVLAGKVKNNGDYYAVKINGEGASQWITPVGIPDALEEARSIKESKDGGYILGGVAEVPGDPDIRASMVKLDANGNFLWEKRYGRTSSNITASLSIGNGLTIDPTGALVLTGYTSKNVLSEDTDVLLIKSNPEGEEVFTNKVVGNVFYDLLNDCTFNGVEEGIRRWTIEATGPDKTFYATTDDFGNYELTLDTFQYEIAVVRPNDYWQTCQSSYIVNFPEQYDTLTRNFAIYPQTNCTDLEVDVSTTFVESCEEAVYTITYCNHGTIEADDPIVELVLSKNLSYESAPPSYQTDSLYGFEINDLSPGECGSFQITARASCDALISETHCIKAFITPDIICAPVNPSWDGSSIAVNGYCDEDSVRFEIANIGFQTTSVATEYIVVEDIVMGFQQQSGPVLTAGETVKFAIGADGTTKRLIARQAEGHPGNSRPTIAVEGCVAGGGTDYSTGYHTQFPEDDADRFREVDCQENILPSTFDAQVKRGYPKGYNDSLKVANTTDFKYHIKFQNVGTDTAIRLVIRDTISSFLDPTTVRIGSSSHDVDFEVYGDGILKFTFNNIMLPDSSTDEEGSHGFVKYRISQKPDNPDGTAILSSAAVYFDYQIPQATNDLQNYVCGPEWTSFIITSDHEVFIPETVINVYPNPISQFATFELEGVDLLTPFDFKIYDVSGRLVRSEQFNSTTFQVDRGNLPSGTFFYEISSEGQLISTGKIITQ